MINYYVKLDYCRYTYITLLHYYVTSVPIGLAI